MRRPLLALAIGVAAVTSLSVQAQGQTAAPRVFVLDEVDKSVSVVDVASGAIQKTVTLQGQPKALVRTPDGRRLLVMDRGLGKDAGDAGYEAKGKSALTILDAASLGVQSRVELCWGLDFKAMMTPGGDRVSFVCPGYAAKKAEENLPRELVTVNLATGQVAGRLPLPRPASSFFGTPDGTTAVILSARDRPKQTPPLTAELRFVDLAGPTVVATLTLEGDPQSPVLSPDGAFVHLLDPGKPSGNPEKNVNGRLYTVSKDTRKLEPAVDVGSNPRGFVLDETGRQLLLLSDRTPVKDSKDPNRGELRVIRGATILPVIQVATKPKVIRAAPAANRLYIVSDDAITGLRLPDLSPLNSTPNNGVGLTEVAVTGDGRRAFSLWDQYVETLDLDAGKALEKITTGRMSSRLLSATVAAVRTAASQHSNEQQAIKQGKSHYTYMEYNLRDPNAAISVRPDGKAAYALNRQTADVTIVDAETGTVIEKVATDGFDVRFLPAANVALVVAGTKVHAIDMVSNKKLEDLAAAGSAGFTRVEVSPDGKYAVVHGRGAVLCIDATSSPVKVKLLPQKGLADVEFDWGPRR
jgi:DNA-binding beta-propeller fold protein YncE